MSSKINMDDIAKELGVSKNTVSLVFRGIPGVNDSTREKILETAKKMGYIYTKNRVQEDKISYTSCICILIPASAKNSYLFFPFIQFGIEKEAKANGLSTIIAYYEDEAGLVDLPICIKEGLVSGIITIGRIKKEVFQLLSKSGLAIVMVDQYFDDLPTNAILSDNLYGGFSATKYLISKGHREVGFIGDTKASISFYDRFMGFSKALGQNGIKAAVFVDKSLEALSCEDSDLVVKELSKIEKFPTAFFCCNDIEAVTLINGLYQMKKRVPEDISVVGFDDIALASNIHPGLTTFRVEKEFMGLRAVKRLLEILESKDKRVEKLVITVRLVERNSVREI